MDIQIVYNKLPFSTFCEIIEYLGLLPYIQYKQFIRDHLSRKYCKKCGEYICSNKNLLDPLHISCRQRYFTVDTKKVKNYHIKNISLDDLLINSIFYNTSLSMFHCSVIFYSKQPTNFYTFNIDKGQLIYKKNINITNIYKNPCFSIIPLMFSNMETRYHPNLSTEECKTVFIKHFKQANLNLLFRSIIKLNLLHKRYHSRYFKNLEPFVLNELWLFVKQNKDLTLHLSEIIGFTQIMKSHNEWIKYLLYNYPALLLFVSETNIIHFFNNNKQWFINYVQNQPKSLNYITLYNNSLPNNNQFPNKHIKYD